MDRARLAQEEPGARLLKIKMSEEQPTFKVKDRRLFNTDGTPRDIEREEEPDTSAAATPAAGASEAGSTREARAATASTEAPPVSQRDERAQPSVAAQPSESGAASQGEATAQMEEDLLPEEDVPGADDPASFINFLMSIASNAAASLGMMEHPVTGQRGVDLPLAKHWIDVLGMLQQKTRGNLAPQEQQIFEGLLADLRLQYVTLTTTPPAAARGFTGRDIIGGK
jgi:hypothetical protein